jgi:hypothetical protein
MTIGAYLALSGRFSQIDFRIRCQTLLVIEKVHQSQPAAWLTPPHSVEATPMRAATRM